ncbi:MAG TPA: hypothetical protein VGF32_07890, partial [Streptosporangiaceae bacterium]
MIDMQLFHDVLLVLAVLIGLSAAFSAAMMMAPSVAQPARPSRPPRGGLRRDRPQPQPEPEPQPQLQLD